MSEFLLHERTSTENEVRSLELPYGFFNLKNSFTSEFISGQNIAVKSLLKVLLIFAFTNQDLGYSLIFDPK